MTEIKVTDAGGESLTMLDFDGFRHSLFGRDPGYIREVYKNLPNFKFRKDDIFIASYPKAGCTWTFEILTMLLSGRTEGHPEGRNKGTTMLEATDQTDINEQPSPRIINSHLPVGKLPQSLFEQKIKTVYVIRNYKDVTVSMYNFQRGMKHYNYDGKWADWLQLHLEEKITYGDYFSYAKQWEDVIQHSVLPVHVVYFEDLKTNTVGEIKRLAEFLHLDHDDNFIMAVAENVQFDAMKKKYSDEKALEIQFKKGANFFRKGVSGDWKNWYTVAQNETVNELIRTKMDNYQTSLHFGAKYDLS